MVAEAAYNALMYLEHQISAGTVRNIRNIHYVNLDAESTSAFTEVFSNAQAGHHSEVTSDRAAVNLGAEKISQPGILTESSSVSLSVGKSSGRKRERRLKTSGTVAAEPESSALMDASNRQKISAASVDDDDTGGMKVAAAEAVDEDCVICLSPMTQPKKLPCGHSFCTDCIDESFKKCQPKCPSCGRLFGVMTGNQPPGTMHVQSFPESLAGFRHCGTLQIMYNIPSGVQNVSSTSNLTLHVKIYYLLH